MAWLSDRITQAYKCLNFKSFVNSVFLREDVKLNDVDWLFTPTQFVQVYSLGVLVMIDQSKMDLLLVWLPVCSKLLARCKLEEETNKPLISKEGKYLQLGFSLISETVRKEVRYYDQWVIKHQSWQTWRISSCISCITKLSEIKKWR